MSNSVSFELQPDMIIGVELAIAQLEEWVSQPYESMYIGNHVVLYSEYLEMINCHKTTLRSMNTLRDYMLSLFGGDK